MANNEETRIVDLSHVIEHGMTTYKGLPGPHICDFWTREGSAENYDDGSSFQIGRIDMVANTGTYLDSPFHRYADGADLAELPLNSLAELPGIVIRRPWENGIEIGLAGMEGLDVHGMAVLFQTGWDRHWRTDRYGEEHPYLTREAAEWLVANGAALVGIDSYNIDDTRVRARPVHTKLLAADIPICEHMTALGSLPDAGFRFSAVPPKISGMGTFPVRAYAVLG
ncbi:cyclase family protein [Sphingomonas hankyongi]|uniref:Cyclase family protein n=1 Tax=Sphingomonas hankyongi TaxID=2908209 RepID=A0ABT0S0C7_9SPHN|nr:cyclase family protein [Sphingomonas hankyongi]MCL6729300.1 cyclase family protein [Sphingomonas hankyongi]